MLDWLKSLSITALGAHLGLLFTFVLLALLHVYADGPKTGVHKDIRIWNGFLAQHQLAYLSYFMTLMLTTKDVEWMRIWEQFGVLLTLFFWVVGCDSLQDHGVVMDKCHNQLGVKCSDGCSLPWSSHWSLYKKNAVRAIVAFVLALLFTFMNSAK